MTASTRRQKSAVRDVADALRRDAIDRAYGELLGSEDDLIRRYGVSRPTLRQAVALVCQENLLRVRRGVGGGYFACRPDVRAVAHVAAVFLRSRKTRMLEVIQAVEPMRVELATLAASCPDPAARDRLRLFVERERSISDDALRYKDFVRYEHEFGDILADMSGNQVIALFLDILYDFSTMLDRGQDIYINRPDRVNEYRAKRNRLAEAVLEGDVEVTIVAARRCAMNISEWMMEGLNEENGRSDLLHLSGDEPTPPPRLASPPRMAAKRAPV